MCTWNRTPLQPSTTRNASKGSMKQQQLIPYLVHRSNTKCTHKITLLKKIKNCSLHVHLYFLPRNPVHKKLWPPSTLGKVLPGPHKVSVLATLWPVIKRALLAGVGFAGGENIDKLSYMYMSVDVMCMDPPSMAHAEVSRVRIENKGPVQGKGR